MDPHVGFVGGGDGVAEPLVAALVDDDEVEARADADAGPVAVEIAVGEVIAVGDGALVLHAGVGNLDQFVAVFFEGILAEVVVVGLHHAGDLGELALGAFEVLGEDVVVEWQTLEVVAEVDVVADVERYVVVVDGVMDLPVPASVAVAQIFFAEELSVGDVHEAVGDGDGEEHAFLRLVAPLLFVGPPDVRAVTFAGGVDPGVAGGIGLEGEAAEAAGLGGAAGVVDVDGVGVVLAEGGGEVDVKGAAVAVVLQRGRAQVDFFDL